MSPVYRSAEEYGEMVAASHRHRAELMLQVVDHLADAMKVATEIAGNHEDAKTLVHGLLDPPVRRPTA